MNRTLLRILQASQFAWQMPWLIRLTGQRIFSPFYHSVQGKADMSHIRHLYPLRTVEQFEADLDYLLRYFEPISLEETSRLLSGQKPHRGPAFFLSFDDGLSELYELIAPILIRKGIPAALFVNSAFVNNKALFFRYKVSLLMDLLFQKSPSRAVRSAIVKSCAAQGLAFSQPADLLGIGYARRSLADELAGLLDYSFDGYLQQRQPYLSTEQLKSLQAKGFAIGAHSIDHPLYAELGLEEQLFQTRQSLEFVSTYFAPALRSFAFPFTDDGVGLVFFNALQDQNLVDISFGSAGLKRDSAPRHYQRSPMELGNFSTAVLVKAAYFAYIVKGIFGKNTIIRQ